jgi:uncharacterized protein
MPLIVNLRHLETQIVRLEGELSPEELDIDTHDEAIRVVHPLKHDLSIQQLEKALLVQGRLHLTLECLCVRCLKPFQRPLELDAWACHLPLQGEDHVAVTNDCVDLTPFVREDILLELPRHPLCEPECRGLPKISNGKARSTSRTGKNEIDLSTWAELNKLKL